MKKQVIFFILCCININLYSQNFSTYNTDNRSHSTRLNQNPSSALDSLATVDIMPFGIISTTSNDYFYWKKSSGDLDSQARTKNYLNSITNIQGPSFSMNINKITAIGLFSGVHIGVAGDFDGQIADAIQNNSMQLSHTNASGAVFAWAEVGLNVARLVYNKDGNSITVGASLKMLSSYGYIIAEAKDISSDLDETNRTYNLDGELSLTMPGRFFDDNNFGFRISPQFGIGADVGAKYTWIPSEYKEHGYKVKAELSILDIGSIKLKKSTTRTFKFNNISVDQDVLDNITLDKLENVFKNNYTDDKSSVKFHLPTRMNLALDYHIRDGLYANFNSIIPLQKNYAEGYNNNYKTSLILTPRYEYKWMGAQIPIGTNIFGDFGCGLGLNLGPVFLGSDNLVNVLVTNKVDKLNFYAGLKVLIKKKYN